MFNVLRYFIRPAPQTPPPPTHRQPNVFNFLTELVQIAPQAGGGTYRFPKPDGGTYGFVQFILESDRRVTIHRIWSHEPGGGSGGHMIRALSKLADRHQVEISLRVVPIGRKPYPLSRPELREWYRRHGFAGPKWKLLRLPRTTSDPPPPLTSQTLEIPPAHS